MEGKSNMLIEVAPPRIVATLDVRYAGADNLTGRQIYARPLVMLRPAAMAALERASALAAAIGLGLVIYDAFRPVEAQWALWRALPDPDYVADPRVGSNHSRGVAVDLGLADRADGRALDMGTGFDEMVERSHHGRTDIGAEAARNRTLLLGIMVGAGWRPIETEWWHYQLPDAETYPLIADGALGPRMM